MVLTEKILYEFLLAEIAGQRGQMAAASELYFDLAKNTRDPRIVRRAAEVALYARQYPTALEASRMWVAIDPQANEAQRMLATLLLAGGVAGLVAYLRRRAGRVEAPALSASDRAAAEALLAESADGRPNTSPSSKDQA